MNIFASVAICFIPLVAFFICVKLLVPQVKISWGLISCLLGLCAVIPIAAIQLFLDKIKFFTTTSLASVLLQALVLNGLIEETIKMLLLFILPAKKIGLSEEPRKYLPAFFTYALLSGLSVASFESLIYVISGYQNIGLRMATAVVIHTCCAGLSGLFVFSTHLKKMATSKTTSSKKQSAPAAKSKRTAKKSANDTVSLSPRLRVIAYIFAVLLHGVYNYFAGFNTSIKYFSFAVILFALIECRVQYKAISDSSIK